MNKWKKFFLNMVSDTQEEHEPFWMKWQFYSFVVIPFIFLILYYFFDIDVSEFFRRN